MARKMRLRRAGTCVGCSVALDAGTLAVWYADEHVVQCSDCHERFEPSSQDTEQISTRGDDDGGLTAASLEAQGREATSAERGVDEESKPRDADLSDTPQVLPESTAEPTLAEADAVTIRSSERDVAGGSAQAEFERRSRRERARKQAVINEDLELRKRAIANSPILGRLADAITPKPKLTPDSQPTDAWRVGAEGERRVAEVLAAAPGVVALHDRLIPRNKANIDHIGVAPAGDYVIDAKKYQGRIEIRNKGGMFRPDHRLFVNGRDHTKTVDGVIKQVDVVRCALGEDFAEVPVIGVLCFIGCEWGLLRQPLVVRDVTSIWPKGLPGFVARAGDFAERVEEIAARLTETLHPALR